MRFKITRHSSVSPPANAIDLLAERIGARRDDVSFVRVGAQISAKYDRESPVSMSQDERVEIGRRAVLALVAEVCERSPELELDWFAVAPAL